MDITRVGAILLIVLSVIIGGAIGRTVDISTQTLMVLTTALAIGYILYELRYKEII